MFILCSTVTENLDSVGITLWSLKFGQVIRKHEAPTSQKHTVAPLHNAKGLTLFPETISTSFGEA